MGRSKEFRLHQKDRKIKRAFKVVKTWNLSKETDEELKVRAKKMADNMKCTKCQCCCNPRHSIWYRGEKRKTIQERKAPEPKEEID